MTIEKTTNKAQHSLEEAIHKASRYLIDAQHPEGYWVGTLQADPSVTAGYPSLMFFMGVPVPQSRLDKIIASLKRKQNTDGSWSSYYGGPGDLSVTVQVYLGLKIAGVKSDEPFMQQAKAFTLSHGGITHTNLVSRIWLALFGQFDWHNVPAIPPELIFLPRWSYINLYECSSWARATIMAMALLSSRQPVCRVPAELGISELYVEPEGKRVPPAKSTPLVSWQRFFIIADGCFKIYQSMPVKPLRRNALKLAEKWVVAHQDSDGSWGGIMLPWIYSLFALKDIGYSLDSPVIKKGLEGLEDFIFENETEFVLQPSVSPVWDTAWVVIALRESGLAEDHPTLVRAARWLLNKHITTKGDWAVKNPHTVPGAWAFEFENRNYPDIDDTAVVCRALNMVKMPADEEPTKINAINAGKQWVSDMQGKDGGWAAFDRENNRKLLGYIPFADFITPLDPASPDVTAHAVEMFGALDKNADALHRAIEYINKKQNLDGSWFGRWGVNYVYGTGLVLPGLHAVGTDMQCENVRNAVRWLKSCQRPDGGWGEDCRSYEESSLHGVGESTPSQTAWAVTGLVAAGNARDTETGRGVSYLLDHQRQDGDWDEQQFTGTGFPRAFYLRYDFYRIYFPLIALSRYRTSMEQLKWIEKKAV